MFLRRREFERISERLDVLAARVEALEGKTECLDEFREMSEEDRKAEKAFLQGIQNIMSFGGVE